MECTLLALYGSLMSPFKTQDRLGMRSVLELEGLCQIPGRLYDLGAYPGLLEAQNGIDKVHAELYRIADFHVLQTLDLFEDYRSGNEEGSLFIRKKMRLSDPDEEAWVYIYNGSVIESDFIECNSWMKHLAERKSNS
ncbi:MAG: hypothetical protein CMP91_01285 [Gammaproteobacteria bacterium]|nr:hypothetical protein [Gammaproteobacteria bacterium]MAY02837.1 hypothetical protein [Gammaproteobacteria bacterium]|tara:strand:+ start:795 stop:1205 length:411 start_codon:yes stop_codon:yes gene_type:complete